MHASVLLEPDQTIKSIVTLITAPHEALEASAPGLSPEQANRLRHSPYLYSNQLKAGFAETGNSLLYIGRGPSEAHTPLIQGSLFGYAHTLVEDLPPEVKTRRLEIYRDSLYSRISDLAKDLGPEWKEGSQHGAAAVKNLEAELNRAVLELQKVHVAPAGNQQALAEIKIAAQRFKDTHKDLLEKLSQWESHIQTHLPTNFKLSPMKYLDAEQVEAALQETNQGEHFKALPVNFLLHEHPAPKNLPAAPSHHLNTLPAQVPASAASAA